MSHTDHIDRARAGQVLAEDEAVVRLLRLAGPRPRVAPERAARVRASVHDRWQQKVASRHRSHLPGRTWAMLAAAATLLAGIGLVLWQRPAGSPAGQGKVAEVERVIGQVQVRLGTADPDAGQQLQPGEAIAAGSAITSDTQGRAALRLAGGSSLRLDTETRLLLVSTSVVRLDQGAVYIDSPASCSNVEVRTTLGVVRDIGTQFEVRASDGRLRVRVREGSVELARDGRSHEAGAGAELTVETDGTLLCNAVPPYGQEWDWVLETAPAFDLEGVTLRAFLDWVARETGWQVQAMDEYTEQAISGVLLHGSIIGLRPDQAPEAVLPTCDLDHHLEQGVLRIGPARGDRLDE